MLLSIFFSVTKYIFSVQRIVYKDIGEQEFSHLRYFTPDWISVPKIVRLKTRKQCLFEYKCLASESQYK